MRYDGKTFDFIDFGASKGDSIKFAIQRLGGTRGLGVDIDPRKVEGMRAEGYDCVEGDITELPFPSRSVRFTVMSHVLEHLPGLGEVEAAIRSAARVSKKFLYILGPYFDADDYLRERGLKLYWSDWRGHTTHLTTAALLEIFERLDLRRSVMLVGKPVISSADGAIHALASPRDQHDYDPSCHPPKDTIELEGVYREFVCCVKLGRMWPASWRSVLNARRGYVPLSNGCC